VPDPLFLKLAQEMGLPNSVQEKLMVYLEEIQRHQVRYGLIKGSQEDLVAHVSEALEAINLLQLQNVGTLFDLGSGVGIPGVVLGIVAQYRYPNLKIYLIERRFKRVKFLEGTIAKLGLLNTEVFSTDASQLTMQADGAVCRAFMPLNASLLNLAKKLIRKGGWLAYFAAKRELIHDDVFKTHKVVWQAFSSSSKERWLCVLTI
jgi:16S rRNA (guanine527-N7)-methyltransferase